MQHLAIANEVGHRAGEGRAYGNLGIAYGSQGGYRNALQHHGQCLAFLKEVGDRAGEGQAYANLGNAYYSQGDYAKAIKYHTQELAIAKEVGDRAGEGRAYGDLGIAYGSQGDYAKAIACHTQDLAIAKEVGDRAGEGRAYGNLGTCHMHLNEGTPAEPAQTLLLGWPAEKAKFTKCCDFNFAQTKRNVSKNPISQRIIGTTPNQSMCLFSAGSAGNPANFTKRCVFKIFHNKTQRFRKPDFTAHHVGPLPTSLYGLARSSSMSTSNSACALNKQAPPPPPKTLTSYTVTSISGLTKLFEHGAVLQRRLFFFSYTHTVMTPLYSHLPPSLFPTPYSESPFV
jgi:tetratricopeptide (TPR) repeat protein